MTILYFFLLLDFFSDIGEFPFKSNPKSKHSFLKWIWYTLYLSFFVSDDTSKKDYGHINTNSISGYLLYNNNNMMANQWNSQSENESEDCVTHVVGIIHCPFDQKHSILLRKRRAPLKTVATRARCSIFFLMYDSFMFSYLNSFTCFYLTLFFSLPVWIKSCNQTLTHFYLINFLGTLHIYLHMSDENRIFHRFKILLNIYHLNIIKLYVNIQTTYKILISQSIF